MRESTSLAPSLLAERAKGAEQPEAVSSEGWMHLGTYSAVAALLGAAVTGAPGVTLTKRGT